MASVSNDPGGRRRIMFFDRHGNRQTIRLGKCAERQALAVKIKIEDLVAASLQSTAPLDETSRWLAGIEDDLHERIARTGLVSSRESLTLGAFIDQYMGQRTDVKGATQEIYSHVRRRLVLFFGESKPLRSITPGDGDQWRIFLLKEGLAENTVRRSCGIAKQFFRAAVRRKMIEDNPFLDLKAAVGGNDERFHFVTLDETQKLLDAALDADWRLLIALARFGGLRTPSESLALRWRDINWGEDKLWVTSSKTEHYEGHAGRWVPIFPELRPYLLDSLERAAEGAEYCITRYRSNGANLRTQLARTAKAAGITLWEKPWQNMRSTRETELSERFPEHVVCSWIGNSVPVARKHYLQVTTEHFRQAAQNAAQKPQEALEMSGKGAPDDTGESAVTSDAFRCLPDGSGLELVGTPGPLGLEPRTS